MTNLRVTTAGHLLTQHLSSRRFLATTVAEKRAAASPRCGSDRRDRRDKRGLWPTTRDHPLFQAPSGRIRKKEIGDPHCDQKCEHAGADGILPTGIAISEGGADNGEES